jgi:lantibiotic modifying enzyme
LTTQGEEPAPAGLPLVDRGVGQARSTIADCPIPFEQVLLPFVAGARSQLETRIVSKTGLLSASAWVALERNLLQRLSALSARTLQLEFSASVALSTARFPVPEAIDRPSDCLYRSFVDRLIGGEIEDLFREHAMLARALRVTVALWTAEHEEFLRRLEADLPALRDIACWRSDVGAVIDIEHFGDPHNGGRRVSFESGRRVIYKPRDVGIEGAYFGFVSWLNKTGSSPPLRALWVLTRPGYGWMQRVDPEPCESERDVRLFYVRAAIDTVTTYSTLAHSLGGT